MSASPRNSADNDPRAPLFPLPPPSTGQSQSFVFSLVALHALLPTDVSFAFSGVDAAAAPTIAGVNTLQFSASVDPVPDIIALSATLPGDAPPGTVVIPGPEAPERQGVGVFAVATFNNGIGASITAVADTGASPVALPLDINLCRTDPRTAAYVSPLGPSVTTEIGADETPTFSIFVTARGTVPFDPAVNRIIVRFKDAGGVTRGSTSVAVRTVAPPPPSSAGHRQ